MRSTTILSPPSFPPSVLTSRTRTLKRFFLLVTLLSSFSSPPSNLSLVPLLQDKELEEKLKDVLAKLSRFFSSPEHGSGRYFLGDKISYYDPIIVIRLYIAKVTLAKWKGFDITQMEEYKPVVEFLERVMEDDVFKRIMPSDDVIIAGWEKLVH